MSLRISSDEASILIIEKNDAEQVNDCSIDNCKLTELDQTLSYTYHRHSAPKDVIYYRCSDKRCPARLRYNLLTKNFVIKNHHLDPSVHKKPSSRKAITSDELISSPDSQIRGPLIISKNSQLVDHKAAKLNLPQKNQRSDSSSNTEKLYLLRIELDQAENVEKLCRVLIDKSLATSTEFFSKGKKFNSNKCEIVLENILEIYTTSQFIEKIISKVNKLIGKEKKVEILCKE